MIAEGSSYIRHQTPGGERLAGLTLKLGRHNGGELEAKIVYTGWSGSEIEEKERRTIEFYAHVALEGIKEFAAEREIDLSIYRLEFSKFLVHPVDTKDSDIKLAGRNAFASAWAISHTQAL